MIEVFLALCWILKCHFVARMPEEVITKSLFLPLSMSEGCVNLSWKQISWKLLRSLEPYGMSLLGIVWRKTCHKWPSWGGSCFGWAGNLSVMFPSPAMSWWCRSSARLWWSLKTWRVQRNVWPLQQMSLCTLLGSRPSSTTPPARGSLGQGTLMTHPVGIKFSCCQFRILSTQLQWYVLSSSFVYFFVYSHR